MAPTVSIIIPALNEEGIIGDTLASLRRLRGEFEVVVVDGGSDDATAEIVLGSLSSFACSKLISCGPGRGPQLNAGARAASGQLLLFLHADTVLPDDAVELITEAAKDTSIVGGNFKMICGGAELSGRIFTWLNRIRRWFGIYYGDSAIWVRRTVFERLSGFIVSPIMEDYDFCRRLEREGRTVCLNGWVTTSSRRWSGRPLITMATWTLIQWLYLLGVSPRRLARLYYRKKKSMPSLVRGSA